MRIHGAGTLLDCPALTARTRFVFVMLGVTLLCVPALVTAQQTIPLWPEGVPGAKAGHGPEQVVDGRVSNVHEPALTVFPPSSGAAGTGVIICPGGAYIRLSMIGEGTEPARFLNARG